MPRFLVSPVGEAACLTVFCRPPAFDKEDYKRRNVVERNFNIF
jgi:hypothetical protein